MNRCPITYEPIEDTQLYSKNGLKLLSPKLITLQPINFSAAEQRAEALARMGKMSIQGVQLKLSAKLKITENCLEIVDNKGQYILKPPHEYYPELPENEALTMSLARLIGIEVPIHGLVYARDKTLTYFIKRFDRLPRKQKLATEDFSQLLKLTREEKYNGSMEKVIKVIEKFCSLPQIELIKLFKLTLFNFLIGNEDMHLKNFSLITKNKIIALSPAYDLLNTTIAQANTKEEIALPLDGKKNNLKAKDFLDYLAIQQLKLNSTVTTQVLESFKQAFPSWKKLIKNSFLSKTMQEKYFKVLEERTERLKL